MASQNTLINEFVVYEHDATKSSCTDYLSNTVFDQSELSFFSREEGRFNDFFNDYLSKITLDITADRLDFYKAYFRLFFPSVKLPSTENKKYAFCPKLAGFGEKIGSDPIFIEINRIP